MNENANEHKIWLSETDSARLSYIKEKITSIVHSTVMAPPRWFQFDNKKNIVEDFLKKLIPSNAFQKLSETERFFLLAKALINDETYSQKNSADNVITRGRPAYGQVVAWLQGKYQCPTKGGQIMLA